MKRLKSFVFLILLTLTACTDPFSHGGRASQQSVAAAEATKSATYSSVAPILKMYCVSCHAGLSTYSNVIDVLGDIQNMVLKTHTMPPNGKPQPSPEQLETLRAWIASGAPADASVTPTPTPPPESAMPATWSYISANIINVKCIKCHTAASTHGSMANYNDLFAAGNGKVVRNQPDQSPMYQVLQAGAKNPMPPKLTGVTVTPAEITAIHDWIAAGAENDLLPQ